MNWENQFSELGEFYPGSSKRIPKPDNPIPQTPRESSGWDEKPRKGIRNGVQYEFFSIRHLAAALGKQPVTMRAWESQGLIPYPGQRSESVYPTKRHRLYTRPQIEGIVRIADEEGILHELRPRIKKTNFKSRVLDLFIELAQLPENGAVPLD